MKVVTAQVIRGIHHTQMIIGLQHSIQEEHIAATVYRIRAKSADPVTRRIYLHIAGEEMGHARQYESRLAVVRRIQKRGK